MPPVAAMPHFRVPTIFARGKASALSFAYDFGRVSELFSEQGLKPNRLYAVGRLLVGLSCAHALCGCGGLLSAMCRPRKNMNRKNIQNAHRRKYERNTFSAAAITNKGVNVRRSQTPVARGSSANSSSTSRKSDVTSTGGTCAC